MEGLLRRAIKAREKFSERPSFLAHGGDLVEQSALESVSEEDRQDILLQIDKIVEASKIQASPGLFLVKATKRGIILPLLVNVGAVVLVFLSVILFQLVFTNTESALQGQNVALESTEGRLLLALREESEANLAAKNKEIDDIRGKLDTIATDRDNLASTMETRLSSRENELRNQLQRELDQERQRLRAQGFTEEEINRRVNEFQRQQQQEYNKRLASFKQELDAEKSKLEASLKELETEYSQGLSRASQDRDRLSQESKKREIELQSRLESERTAAGSAIGQAQLQVGEAKKEMERLAAIKEQEKTLNNQIIAFYSSIRDQLRAQNYDEASRSIQLLKTFLQGDQISQLDGLRQRRETETFIADSLLTLVDKERRSGQVQTMLENSMMLQEVQQIFTSAKVAQNSGNRVEATRLYQQAVSRIPEVNQANAYLSARSAELVSSVGPEADVQRAQVLELAQAQFTADLKKSQEQFDQVQTRLNEVLAREVTLKQDAENLQRDLKLRSERETSLQVRLRQQEEALTRIDANQNAALVKTNQTLQSEKEALQVQIQNLSQTIKSLESQLVAQQNLNSNSNSAGQATGNTQLQKLLDELRFENGKLAKELSDSRLSLAALQSKLESGSSGSVDLQKQLDALRAESNQATKDRDAALQDVSRLQQNLLSARTSLERAAVLTERYAGLVKVYANYASESSKMKTDTATGVLRAKLLLDSFFANEMVVGVFPGLGERVRGFDRLIEQSAQENIVAELSDVIYTTGSYTTKSERKTYLEDLVRKSGNVEKKEFFQNLIELIVENN